MLNFDINTNELKTLNGRFKIVEFVMVMIDLMIVRLDKKNWSGPVGDINVIDGTMDNPLDYGLWMGHGDFLGTGVIVGYAIIVPCILLNYIIGGGISQLEFFINFIGGVLFITVGCLALKNAAYITGLLLASVSSS